MSAYGQIVGLSYSDSGRACNLHQCCGEHVQRNDLNRFEEAFSCLHTIKSVTATTWAIWEGCQSNQNLRWSWEVFRRISSAASCGIVFATVIEVYRASSNKSKQQVDYRNEGVTDFELLENIPSCEWLMLILLMLMVLILMCMVMTLMFIYMSTTLMWFACWLNSVDVHVSSNNVNNIIL